MFPTLIEFGGFKLATYGLLVAAGYMTGILWLNARRDRMGLSEARFWGLVYALFFGAIAGGKILYWILEFDALRSGQLRLIRDIRFGFVFYGGLAGTLLMGFYYTRKHKLDFLNLSDYFLTPLPLGHAIGRLGCFAAGCCAGRPTNLPWGVVFDHPDSLVHYALRDTPLHPTQLYEAGANFLIAGVMFRLLEYVRKKRYAKGSAAALYVGLYSVSRFVIEFFRGDDRGGFFLTLSPSQWIAVAALGASVYFLRRLNGSGARQ